MASLLRDRRLPGTRVLVTAGLVTAALTWAYWTTLGDMVRRWSTDATYSHGYLVPVFAALLLYARRGLLDPHRLRPS
jgi:hypothetical protein